MDETAPSADELREEILRQSRKIDELRAEVGRLERDRKESLRAGTREAVPSRSELREGAPNRSGPEPRHRPLRLLDLMALVAAVALTLISPRIMKAIIGNSSLHNWDRRQYVAHLTALVMIWWTLALVPPVLSGVRLRRAIRNYGRAAILASATAALLLVLRQAPVVLLLALTVGWSPTGLFPPRLFDVMEHAPDTAAAAVVVAWTVLALTGAGRRPSNWLEQLGCHLGATWILLGILTLLVYFVPIPWLRTSGITW